MNPIDEPESAETLAALIMRISAGDEDAGVYQHLTVPKPLLKSLLSDLSLDRASFFGRYGVTDLELADHLDVAIGLLQRGELAAQLSVVLLFLTGIAYSSRIGNGGSPPDADEHERLAALVRREGVPKLLQDLYEVAIPQHGVCENIGRLHWDGLAFYRLGTTSLVFQISTVAHPKQTFVLKLSHVLFETVGPIAEATREYAEDWSAVGHDCPWIVRVLASSLGWVFEEYIPGKTLREIVTANLQAAESPAKALDVLRDTFLPVVDSLAHLHGTAHRGHGDLTPSNIILVQRSGSTAELAESSSPVGDPKFVARFIDMGPNLLATESVGRVRSAESRFVAPEVLTQDVGARRVDIQSDYYSLGKIMLYCVGYNEEDGLFRLDSRAFLDSPELTGVAARLVDEDPSRRLDWTDSSVTVPGRATEEQPLSRLLLLVDATARLRQTVDAEAAHFDRKNVGAQIALFAEGLLGNVPRGIRAAKLLIALRRSEAASVTYNKLVSARVVLASLMYGLGVFVFFWTILMDYNWAPLPLISDTFSALGYNTHDASLNWQIRIVSATFLVAGYQYSTQVFGGITFWFTSASKAVRVMNEAALWLMTTIVVIFMGLTFLWEPRYWPILTAAGLVVVDICNLTALIARNQIIANIRLDPDRSSWLESSNVMRKDQPNLLIYWLPTLLVYTLTVAGLGIAIVDGVAHDALVYAIEFGVVNIFIFSYSQATQQGPYLRGNLAQFVVAGERFERAPRNPDMSPASVGSAH